MRAFIVGGQLRESDESFDVRSPWDDSLVESVAVPRDSDIEDAAALAHTTFAESRLLPAHVRIDALTHISQRLDEQRDELATQIAREGGKPLKWARVEAARAVSTFRIAAEEVRRWGGDFLRLDTEASLGARAAIVRRFPIGPVLGIAPFNFPLNLVAHKVAPALAVGAPIVVKPATATPLSALSLAEIIAETELPKGMISVLPVSGARAEQLVRDRRFPKVSFTGSTDVGWRIKALEPRKRFTLELGGNAGVIVHSDADLDRASERIAFGGYYQAGQSCISVQRILVQSQVFDSFSTRLVKQVSGLVVGDPLDPATDVGPLIDTGALDRVESWVQEAESQGARVLCGGKREGRAFMPTVLSETRPEMKVRCEEIFGPVTTLDRYETFEEAIAEVNRSRYGLQAGVFTSDMERAFVAHRDIEVGGVIVNDMSAFRADQMPYGGVKDSGIGREGLRYAMEEMTDSRIMVVSGISL